MLRHLYRHDRSSTGRINMTPMIDVTFLLLTFFLLAGHLHSAGMIDIKLPQPDDSQALDRRFKEKVIVNVLDRGPGHEPALTFGATPVGSMIELADRLSALARVNPQAQVILRADRNLSYGDVRQVMELIAAQNLTRLQVAAELD